MNILDMRKYLLSFLFLMTFVWAAPAQNEPPRAEGKFTPLKITKKAQPTYTEAAAVAKVEGVVALKVVFLASGKIGDVTYPKTRVQHLLKEDPLLKYGLVDKAIEAAKQIEFIPATRDGVPISIVKSVEYEFWL